MEVYMAKMAKTTKFFNILLMALGLAAIGMALFQGWQTNIGLQEDALLLGPLGLIISNIFPMLGTFAIMTGYQGLPE